MPAEPLTYAARPNSVVTISTTSSSSPPRSAANAASACPMRANSTACAGSWFACVSKAPGTFTKTQRVPRPAFTICAVWRSELPMVPAG